MEITMKTLMWRDQTPKAHRHKKMYRLKKMHRHKKMYRSEAWLEVSLITKMRMSLKTSSAAFRTCWIETSNWKLRRRKSFKDWRIKFSNKATYFYWSSTHLENWAPVILWSKKTRKRTRMRINFKYFNSRLTKLIKKLRPKIKEKIATRWPMTTTRLQKTDL